MYKNILGDVLLGANVLFVRMQLISLVKGARVQATLALRTPRFYGSLCSSRFRFLQAKWGKRTRALGKKEQKSFAR